MSDDETLFFRTPAELRRWLKKHHATATEQWVGFHKKKSGVPSITWPESVDEALCFGWVDGLRKTIDEDRYRIRFTPRKATSNWSKINVAKVAALEAEGRMTDAGRAAFARRKDARTGIYSFEREEPAVIPDAYLKRLKADRAAWKDWQKRPPGYQRIVTHWIMSAKREETRERRLATLIEHAAEGRTIPPLTRKPR